MPSNDDDTTQLQTRWDSGACGGLTAAPLFWGQAASVRVLLRDCSVATVAHAKLWLLLEHLSPLNHHGSLGSAGPCSRLTACVTSRGVRPTLHSCTALVCVQHELRAGRGGIR